MKVHLDGTLLVGGLLLGCGGLLFPSTEFETVITTMEANPPKAPQPSEPPPPSKPEWLASRPPHMPCEIEEVGTSGPYTQVWFLAYDSNGQLIRSHRKLVGGRLKREAPPTLDDWTGSYSYDDQGRLRLYVERDDKTGKPHTRNVITYPEGGAEISGLNGNFDKLIRSDDGRFAASKRRGDNGRFPTHNLEEQKSIEGQKDVIRYGYPTSGKNPFEGQITYLAGQLIVGQSGESGHYDTERLYVGTPEGKLAFTTLKSPDAVNREIAYKGPNGGISSIQTMVQGFTFIYCE